MFLLCSKWSPVLVTSLHTNHDKKKPLEQILEDFEHTSTSEQLRVRDGWVPNQPRKHGIGIAGEIFDLDSWDTLYSIYDALNEQRLQEQKQELVFPSIVDVQSSNPQLAFHATLWIGTMSLSSPRIPLAPLLKVVRPHCQVSIQLLFANQLARFPRVVLLSKQRSNLGRTKSFYFSYLLQSSVDVSWFWVFLIEPLLLCLQQVGCSLTTVPYIVMDLQENVRCSAFTKGNKRIYSIFKSNSCSSHAEELHSVMEKSRTL